MNAPRHRRTRVRTLFVALGFSAAAHSVVLPFLRLPASAQSPEATAAPIEIAINRPGPTPPPTLEPTRPPTPVPRMVTHISPHVVTRAVPQRYARVGRSDGAQTHARAPGTHVVAISGDTHVGSKSGRPDVDQITSPATEPPVEASPTPVPLASAACTGVPRDATVVTAVTPERPEVAQEEGALGRVEVRVDLSAAGLVAGAEVNRSSGNPALDDAAVRAAMRARYAPASNGCIAIGGSYLYTVDFTE